MFVSVCVGCVGGVRGVLMCDFRSDLLTVIHKTTCSAAPTFRSCLVRLCEMRYELGSGGPLEPRVSIVLFALSDSVVGRVAESKLRN